MKRNIIITGGGFANKGAQAMTFIAVSELKKRFPDHEILVLSTSDVHRNVQEPEHYNFKFIGWYPQKFAKCQSNSALRMACLIRNKQELLEAESIYKNTDLMIDISGYAIGNNWPAKICNDYLDNFQFAKAFGIPVYLFPQSFGPFEFNNHDGMEIDSRIRDLFPGFKMICAREQDGYHALIQKYNLNNVILTPDLVLNNKGIDVNAVFKILPDMKLPEIQENSVCVIPNKQNFTVNDKNFIMQLYVQAIENVIRQGRYVYIMHHSSVDIGICKDLKASFQDNERVILLEQEFSCLEFNEVVKLFDYVIASRFHSIVHAYKNGIPSVTLGWAEKYAVLHAQFNQDEYMLDTREEMTEDHIKHIIEKMERDWTRESKEILSNLEVIQKNNIFDILKL